MTPGDAADREEDHASSLELQNQAGVPRDVVPSHSLLDLEIKRASGVAGDVDWAVAGHQHRVCLGVGDSTSPCVGVGVRPSLDCMI